MEKNIHIQYIEDLVLQHNLEERTIAGFWNYFNNFQKECADEFQSEFPNYDKNEVEVSIDSVSLRLTNWPEDGYNHIVLLMRMHYKERHSGFYRMVFSLDGEIEDDHLSLF